MNLDFTPEEQAFREEMRAFMRARLPAHIRAKVMAGARLSRADYLEWQRILHAHGYSGHNWPARFGGPGWTPVQQYIFEEEMALAGGPRLIPFGIKMVAPVIMEFGSAWQQEYFLPRIRSGEHWWCQGYSEPGAGSDLASLKTRAERKGGRYIVNGQNTWTTYAQYADWIFCLVRTGSGQRPQESISFLLIDMKSPGVSVRPIRLNDGTHDVNDVWFENVEVPVEHLVGEENRGWTYAKFLLGHERANIAGVGIAKRELGLLKRLAAGTRQDGRRLIEDPRFADRIARLELELMALELTNLRVISAEQENRAPGPEASILKIKGSEIQQALAELMLYAAGPASLAASPEALEPRDPAQLESGTAASNYAANYFGLRKLSIFGGSNEIQKNIVARAVLGL